MLLAGLHFSETERGEFVNPWPWLVEACDSKAESLEIKAQAEIVK